jgi:perosamine synthetase
MKILAVNGGKKVISEGHVKWPSVIDRDKEYVLDVFDRREFWGVYAHHVRNLEKEWAEYSGTEYSLSCNSGTAALHMATGAAEIGPGDEVITPSLTFVATQLAVLYQNALPVFVDVDPRTFNIDPKKIEEKITERTKAIIPVYLHGLTADMDEINRIAKKYNLVVIADACQAPGALYKGRKGAALADMSTFSLNGLKNLQCGDGGLFNTDNPEYQQKANQVRIFGEIVREGEPRDYNSRGIGYMYRLTEFSAAYTRSRLIDLDDENDIRIQNAEYLTKHLSEFEGIITPYIPDHSKSVYHHYRIRFDPEKLGIKMHPREFRARIQKAMVAEGAQAQRWQTRPVQKQTLFIQKNGYGKGCPWSCQFGKNGVMEYSPYDYIETQKILDDSIIFHDAIYPPNGIDIMEQYVEVFKKLWNNLDEVISIDLKENDPFLID